MVGLVGLGLAWIAPSNVSAQTLSLGQAGQYGIFEVAGDSGHLSVTNATINGNVGLGSLTTDRFTNSSITGSVSNLATGAQANADAINASRTAALLATTGSMSGNQIHLTNGSVTFTGKSGQNVVDLKGINLTNSTFTINGTSTERFIFNVSGSSSITNSQIALSGGVTANDVIFNFSGTGHAVSLTNSRVNGTFLDLKGSISATNGSTNGAFISEASVSITGDPLTGKPFTVAAPELPTIMMAGLACLIVLGMGGLNRFRQRSREFSGPAVAHTPGPGESASLRP